jgi:hypothetical protein
LFKKSRASITPQDKENNIYNAGISIKFSIFANEKPKTYVATTKKKGYGIGLLKCMQEV